MQSRDRRATDVRLRQGMRRPPAQGDRALLSPRNRGVKVSYVLRNALYCNEAGVPPPDRVRLSLFSADFIRGYSREREPGRVDRTQPGLVVDPQTLTGAPGDADPTGQAPGDGDRVGRDPCADPRRRKAAHPSVHDDYADRVLAHRGITCTPGTAKRLTGVRHADTEFPDLVSYAPAKNLVSNPARVHELKERSRGRKISDDSMGSDRPECPDTSRFDW